MELRSRLGGDAAVAVPAEQTSATTKQPALLVLVIESAKSILRTIVTLDAKESLNRTALFMILFLVIHCAGNLSFFAGKAAFNSYAHMLTTGPIGVMIKGVEYYLLAAAAAHVVAAGYQTVKNGKLVPSKKEPIAAYPFGKAKLALTGMFITWYIWWHLTHFYFPKEHLQADQNGIKDLHGLQLEVLKDPLTAAIYIVAIFFIGSHLWTGWAKTVFKFDVPSEQRKDVVSVGRALVVVLMSGYAACAVGAYLEATTAATMP